MSDQNFFSYGDAESVLANYANEIKNTKVLSSSVTIGAETETTVEGAIGAVADVIPETASEDNKLATITDITGEDVAATAMGTAITITDSIDARVQNIQIFGRTENGSSVGDNGLTVSVPGKNLFNINGEVNTNTVNNTTPPQNWTIDISNKKNTVSGNVLTAYRDMSGTWPDGQVIAVKAGQTYTLSFRLLESEYSGCVRVDYWNSSTSKLVYQVNWWKKEFTRQSITFVAQTNSILLGFGSTGANRTVSFTDIMLEEGGQTTDYEPYRLSTLSITTGLPLRGILKTVDLGTIDWGYNSQTPNTGGYPAFPRFFALNPVPDVYVPFPAGKASSMYMDATASCSSRYTVNVYSASGSGETVDKTICVGRNGNVYIVDYDYTSAASLKAALSGIILTYPSYCDEFDTSEGIVKKRVDTDGTALDEPIVTPLSAAELSAYRQLRTHAGSTKINVTDTPYIAVSYLKNTENGKAVAAAQDDADKQINNKQDVLTFDSTPTENSTNPITSGGIYSALAGKQEIMQLSTLPIASSELLGKIYQYVGTTNSTYINGFFYKCVESATIGTYEWQALNVQANGAIWFGTQAEHDAAEQAGTLPNNTLIIIDDSGSEGGETDPVTIAHIYGAEWDGTGTTAWSRTDEAAEFVDPVPVVNNSDQPGSSPFDNILPWSGMVREERTGGTMVKIPKFWYKWTRVGSSMKLQIADAAVEGFLVSPAHADRGDGKGERDYVYVGAYHCGGGETDTYKSKAGVLPMVGKTRAEFRTAIHNLGSNIWQYDYAMYWTIAMLYLVEFANWNSGYKIGYGCGNNTGTENNGACDAMAYHTGTDAVSRTEYGHIRYRYIEGLWDNVLDCCDGIYFDNEDIYCIKNPANFSESTGGTLVGTRSSSNGWITGWSAPAVTGFEYALFPNVATGGSNHSYICDYYTRRGGTTSVYLGGGFGQKLDRGLFCVDSTSVVSASTDFIGSRIMELP